MKRAVYLLVGVAIIVASSLSASADNRVAPSFLGAPHVSAMTTPGSCASPYSPGIYNTIPACISCDYGATYYPLPYPAVCALCPRDRPTYNPNVKACF